ncbi:MAG: plasmid mobilization protein [Lachnospiraceae bacterium]
MPPKEKSKELKHRNIICLKLTDIELEILNQAASSVGISRSEYLRRLFLNKPIQIHYEVVADIKLLRELVGQYGKIGSNLNQIAKYFNTGGTHSQAMENEIHQCISDLFLLRKKVLEMAGDFHGDTKTHQK